MLYDQSFIGNKDNKVGVYLIDNGFVGGDSSGCYTYLFSSSNSDYHEFGSAFTGNLKVIAKSSDETGLATEVIAGRQGAFVADEWLQYEIEAVALTGICDATFNGVIGRYYKDDVMSAIDMGPVGSVVQFTVLGQFTVG